MVIARSTRDNVEYTLAGEQDLDREDRTVFTLAVLPNSIMLVLLELESRGEQKATIELALRAGLRGWRNFPDEQGAETPFRSQSGKQVVIHGAVVHDPMTLSTFEKIPTRIMLELTQAVINANQLALDQAKN